MFRPPYFGDAKPLYSTNDLQAELLPTLAATDGAPSFDEIHEQFRRVWLDHKVGWTGRPLHPTDTMPDYGSDIAVRTAQGALALMLEGSVDDKWGVWTNRLTVQAQWYRLIFGVRLDSSKFFRTPDPNDLAEEDAADSPPPGPGDPTVYDRTLAYGRELR